MTEDALYLMFEFELGPDEFVIIMRYDEAVDYDESLDVVFYLN